jgi:hypothetical protein
MREKTRARPPASAKASPRASNRYGTAPGHRGFGGPQSGDDEADAHAVRGGRACYAFVVDESPYRMMSLAPRHEQRARRVREAEPADDDELPGPCVDDAGVNGSASIHFSGGYLRALALGLFVGVCIIAAIILNGMRM